MTVERNVEMRRIAGEVHQLAVAESDGFTDGAHFWECLDDLIHTHYVRMGDKKTLTSGAMDESEARRFGLQTMPFGEFAGSRVDDVSMERLSWYADQRFVDELRRYLKSPVAKVRWREEEVAEESWRE